MSVAELKRCFECGATYPSQTVACASDGTPLTFDTVGRRWKVDGVLTRRVGGAVFSAFHLIEKTRAAIDLLPGENARDATASDRLQKQLQALRLLDQHKNILRLLEDGTERDGSRFFVCELLQARPLQDVIDERQRPAVGLIEPATATVTTTAFLRPLHDRRARTRRRAGLRISWPDRAGQRQAALAGSLRRSLAVPDRQPCRNRKPGRKSLRRPWRCGR